MHRLLERQLKRHFGSLDALPAELAPLISAIDATYQASDDDRSLLEHSMDLTSQELLQRNEDLARQQRMQQVIFDSVPAMIIYKDTENRILRINGYAAKALGKTVRELEGADTYQLFPREIAAALHADDLEVVRSDAPKLGIVEAHPGADGLHWMRTDKVPFRDHAGRVVGVIVFSVDITETRRAEERLRESEERYRLIVETATEGIWSLDTNGKTVFANHVMAELLGTTRADLEKANVMDFMPPEDVADARTKLGALMSGATLRLDWRFRRRDGRDIWVQASGSPIRAPDGRVLGALGMMTDITERRQAELDLREAYGRLQEVDRSRAQFLNTAAHELGTPLTPLALQIQVVRNRFANQMTEPQRRSLDILQRSVDRLQSLVRDLLDAARVQTDRLRVTARQVDLTELARLAVEAFRDMANDAKVELEADLPGPISVHADPDRLGQVFDNLLTNAIKFTPAGGKVRVVASREHGHAVVRVSDSGIGLDPASVPRLFQPFSQVHDVMAVNKPGTGLGLYICRGIVHQMGGQVTVMSPGLGKGSTFSVELPVDASGAPAAAS